MHILGNDQKRPTKDRSSSEKAFQRLNTIVVAIQLACFLIVIAQLSLSSSKSISSSFFVQTALQITDPALLNNTCSLDVVTSSAGFEGVALLYTHQIIPFVLSKNIMEVRACLAANAVVIVIGIVNKLFFDFNAHEVRYHFLTFRKEVLSVWEFFGIVVSFVTTKSAERSASLIGRYLEACGNNNGNSYTQNIPMVPFYISLSLLCVVHFVSAMIALKNMFKKHPRDDLTRSVDDDGNELVLQFDGEGEEANFGAEEDGRQ